MAGTEPINAKERYVNILLQVASEVNINYSGSTRYSELALMLI